MNEAQQPTEGASAVSGHDYCLCQEIISIHIEGGVVYGDICLLSTNPDTFFHQKRHINV